MSFEFALLIIEMSEVLETKRKYVVAKQLLKAGTSIGANVKEAQSAESKADFVHKLKIAHKEALETEYWMDLMKHSETYPNPSTLLEDKLLSIKKLLNKIISSAKKKPEYKSYERNNK
ncbi:four helix bundle protein [Ancylomarina euxinus]|nr:four helix bundle protein [Ancylomarina euxinus]MCZ4694957.1 four helix bundle protein [Ancylomarina euxinus]